MMGIIERADMERKRQMEEGAPPRLIPLGHRVLVRRDPPRQNINLGNGKFLWIPEETDENSEGQFATVLAIGIGRDYEGRPVEGRFPVSVGDRVVLYEHGGTRVTPKDGPGIPKNMGDDLHYLICVEDLMGIVTEEPSKYWAEPVMQQGHPPSEEVKEAMKDLMSRHKVEACRGNLAELVHDLGVKL